MNPLHVLTTPGVSIAEDRPLGPARPARPLNHAAGALIALPAKTTIHGLRLSGKMLSVLLPATDNRRLRPCADCGRPVTKSDPFIRYRGEYYHAHGCAETNPPALSQRRARASPTGT